RRRHTRSDRDWSSDVCSSDLKMITCRRCYTVTEEKVQCIPYTTCKMVRQDHCYMETCRKCTLVPEVKVSYTPYTTCKLVPETHRSEERRVGKEWRARRKQYHD